MGFQKNKHLLVHRDLLLVCVKCCICQFMTGHWDVGRRCNPGSRCGLIKCTKEHCPVPVDRLSRHGYGARMTASRTATCDDYTDEAYTYTIKTSYASFWKKVILPVRRRRYFSKNYKSQKPIFFIREAAKTSLILWCFYSVQPCVWQDGTWTYEASKDYSHSFHLFRTL